MPPVVAAVAGAAVSSAVTGALAGTALAGTFLASAASSVIGGIVSYGVNSLFGAGAGDSQSYANTADGYKTINRSSVATHKIIYGRANVSGALAFVDTRTGGNTKQANSNTIVYDAEVPNQFIHLILPLAAHEINAFEQFYFDNVAITLDVDKYATNTYLRKQNKEASYFFYLARLRGYFGTTTQVADTNLINETAGIWTANHRLLGIAYMYARLQYVSSAFPNGIPNLSCVVQGKKLYDPRSGTTAYSNNSALVLYDYITNSQYGLGADAATEIDTASFIAAANICDENVTVGGTTQKRYTFDGVIDTASLPVEVMRLIADSMAGFVFFSEGKYFCLAGDYSAPTIEIDNSWLAGDIGIQTKMPKSQRFNTVKGVYVEPSKGWQPTDYPAITNSTYIAQDAGEEVIRDFPTPFSIDVKRSQRLAKILLNRSRQGIVCTVPCNFKALQLQAGDMVAITNSYLGWSSKAFRVLRWELQPNMGGVVLTCQEEASDAYDWASDEGQDLDVAPDTNLPNPFDVEPPTNLAIEETQIAFNSEGGVAASLDLSWTASVSAFITGYESQYKLDSATSYISISTTAESPVQVLNLEPGVYNFRVRSINSVGAKSDWAELTAQVFGLTAAPDDITGFSLNDIAGNAHLSWNQSTSIPVKLAGQIRVRHSSATSGATWSEAIDISPALPGIATSAVVPLLAGTYLIKAVDAYGRESVNAATIVSNVSNVVAMNAIATNTQDPAFSGTKTNMIASAGVLSLDGTILFDDGVGLFDDGTGLFDAAGGTYSLTGSYEFDTYTDVGQVYTSRLSVDIEQLIYDSTLLFDDGEGLFDDGVGLFDGTENAAIEVKVFIATTDDDPAGSPTWSAWRQFIVGDYTARAFKFKIEVTSSNSTYNIDITRLRVNIDVPDRVESAADVAMSASGTTITYTKEFQAEPALGVTVQDMATGDYYTITAKSTTGFTIRTFNAGGTGIAKTFDWVARGY